MSRGGLWTYGGVAVAAAIVSTAWPLTSALSAADALQVRAAVAILAALVCALVAVTRAGRAALWLAVSLVAAAAAMTLSVTHFNAASRCIAIYDGRPLIIGREFRTDAAVYAGNNPGLSAADYLLDAAGAPERIWTTASIQSCRFWVSWGGLATVPLLALSAAALIARSGQRFVLAPKAVPVHAPTSAVVPARVRIYDAFLSYRHTEPDRAYALEIVESLEQRGLRAAIDVRDFAANEHFLSEMERCIKQSRFVLCVITAQYVASEHTSEEAIISKTLDLAERSRRLVPLVFERVELPIWLHGLVGIDFTPTARIDPLERLHGLLRNAPTSPDR